MAVSVLVRYLLFTQNRVFGHNFELKQPGAAICWFLYMTMLKV